MDYNEATKRTLYNIENILYPIITVFGILSNVLVITVLTIWEKSRLNRTVANMFIVNLAVADLLFLVILPFYIPIITEVNGWIYGSFMCKLFSVIKYLTYRASISFLTTMSVDRYLAIVYPLTSRRYRTRSNATKTCVVLWIVSLVTTVPAMLYANVPHHEDAVPVCHEQFPGYNKLPSEEEFYDYFSKTTGDTYENLLDIFNSSVDYSNYITESSAEDPIMSGSMTVEIVHECTHRGHENSTPFTAWVYFGFFVYFVIPVLITVFCYCAIIWTTLTRKISTSKSKAAHRQVAVTVAVLISAFIICWLPFQVFELLQLSPTVKVSNVNACMIMEYTFTLLAWVNSAINPILYSLSSQNFRDKTSIAWVYLRYGHNRALALRASQRTMQTRLHTLTASGTSTKSMNAPASPIMAEKEEVQPMNTLHNDEDEETSYSNN